MRTGTDSATNDPAGPERRKMERTRNSLELEKIDFHPQNTVGPEAVRSFRNRISTAFMSVRELLRFPSDAAAIYLKDPALRGKPLGALQVILYASFWALLLYRIGHMLHSFGLSFVARLVSQAARLLTGIEIHPGAEIGPGFFIDHGMGTVIGETAVIGKDVLLFHGVTLGGVSFLPGRRHPELGDHIIVGAGAKILGPVTVGSHAKIGAMAVVLTDIPEGATAVGIPARIIERKDTNIRPIACCGGASD